MRRTLGCILVLLLATAAQAQVFRCTEGGKTTYSDTPCASSQSGQQIARQKSRQQLDIEQTQAEESEWRKQQRRMDEQQRNFAEQQQRSMQPMPAPVVRHSGNDWQTRKDLENAQTSAGSITNNGGRWDGRKQRRRVTPYEDTEASHFPKEITRCSGQYCYDRDGQSYHSIGNGQIRSLDGTTCTLSGNQYVCR